MKKLIKNLTIVKNISVVISMILSILTVFGLYLHMETETTIIFIFFVVFTVYLIVLDETIIKLKKEIRKHD